MSITSIHDHWNSLSSNFESFTNKTHHCNVCLVGFSGHGKSSYVRSIQHLLEFLKLNATEVAEYPLLPPIAVAGGVGEAQQCIVALKPYEVDIHNKWTVRIFDVRGVSSEEISDTGKVFSELDRVAKGKMQYNELMDMNQGFLSGLYWSFFRRSSISRSCTTFLLVHRFDKVKKIFHEDHVGRWNPLIKKIRNTAGMQMPSIVITGADITPRVLPIKDTEEDKVRQNMGSKYEPDSIESVQRYVHNVLGIPMHEIYFVENLSRVEEIDSDNAEVLLNSFASAVKSGCRHL